MRTNAPRIVTVLLALALTVVGLSLTVMPIAPVNDLLRETGVRLTREHGYWALLASPLLLVLGSFLKGL